MTIAVDWDIKPQTKQNVHLGQGKIIRPFFLLVVLREFVFRFRVGGTKKNEKKL